MVTGAELKELRRQLNLTQQDLAEIIGRTQKSISLWETGRNSVPINIGKFLSEEFRHRLPGGTLYAAYRHLQESKVFSWPSGLFELLWSTAPKRARQVTVDTVLEPSRTSPGFADATLKISFEELEVPEGERLYLDHLGIAGSEFTLENVEAKRAKVKQVVEASKGTDQGSTGLGPFAVAYEISEADKLDKVSVTLRAKKGVDFQSMDGVGFPMYSDFLVERLTINATFKGIRPYPHPVIPRAFLIRRTALRLHGLLKHFEPPTIEDTIEGIQYHLGPLMRLKGGFLYGLAWERLDLTATTEVQRE